MGRLTRDQKRLLNRQSRVTMGIRLGDLLDEIAITDTAEIRDRAVTSGKIALLAVIEALIGPKAVTQGKIGDKAVGTGQIDDGAVTEDKLAADVRAPIWSGADVTIAETFSEGHFVKMVGAGTVQDCARNDTPIGLAAADADPEDPGFVHAMGIATAKAQCAIAAGDPVKAGTDGKAISFIDAGKATVLTGTGANFGNQPAGGTVTIASGDEADTTQTATVYGTLNADDTYVEEELALNGDTPVIGEVIFKNICGVRLDASCAGTVTLTKTSGGGTIVAITTGNLSAGILDPEDLGQAGNQQLAINTADTEQVIIEGIRRDGTTTPEVVTGTSGSDTTTAYWAQVTALMVGDCAASTRTLTAAEDDVLSLGGIALAAAAVEDDEIAVLLRSAIALPITP